MMKLKDDSPINFMNFYPFRTTCIIITLEYDTLTNRKREARVDEEYKMN